MIFAFTPTWQQSFTLNDFAETFGEFRGDGWYVKGNDHALAYMRAGMVWVSKWDTDPRPSMLDIISWPDRTPGATHVTC